ncbi:MAG: hypothetical protein N3C12_09840 [Candidatus Binatia bacterium]|nr:hypothetical protein [Candidatus Binatia bacterium]
MGPRETRWLKRTVLIGLGGTGKEALLRVKKKYVEVFGEVPPLVRFLLIDTTPAATDAIHAEDPEGRTTEVSLEPNEVLFIEARGASMLPRTHDEIRQWFPPKADLKSNIISGAGQIRALGRLALFANAHCVYEGLRALLSQARDYLLERPAIEHRYVYRAYTPHLTVCVIGSLAGGTGSGIFLDVAMILRDILKDEDQLFGYLLLPDIYINRPGTQNVEANAYGALRELDYYMSLEGTHRYSFGGREIEVRKKPFDMVFLVNNRNRAGKTFNDIEHMAELLGLGAFLVSGPLGKEQADVFDNIVMQLTEQQGAFYGKRAHFASFGAAELRFRPEQVNLERARREASDALQRLFSADGREWGVTEFERKLHAVVTSELPKSDPLDVPRPTASRARSRDEECWRTAQEAFRRLEERACEESVELLKKEIARFEQELAGEIERSFGLYAIPSFLDGLEKLRTQAHELAQQLKRDLDDEQQRRKESDSKFAQQLPVQRRWFGRLRADDEEQPKVNRSTIQQRWEMARAIGHKEARWRAAFELEKALEQKIEELRWLQGAASEWLTRFAGQTQQAVAPTVKDVLPFTVTLPPPYLPQQSTSTGGTSDGLERLKQRGFAQLCENPERVLDEVFRPSAASSLRDWLIDVARRERSDYLREAVERALVELDALSAPAWDYQDAWLANPHVARREQVHIIGIEDKNDSLHPLLVGEFRKIFAGNVDATRKLAVVSTGDPKRIYLYKIEASIPAFTLQGIEMYRERYLDLSSDRSFHVDRQLEQHIPELVPVPSGEDAALIWTKAQLFGLIRYDSRTMTFQRRGQQDSSKEGWHELGRSLGQAFACFQRDFFGFKELESMVNERERGETRNRLPQLINSVREALDYSRKQLELANSSGNGTGYQTPEDRRVLEAQIAVLQRWQEELVSYRPPDREYKFPTLGAE